jgi:hypothetical protein
VPVVCFLRSVIRPKGQIHLAATSVRVVVSGCATEAVVSEIFATVAGPGSSYTHSVCKCCLKQLKRMDLPAVTDVQCKCQLSG